MFDLDYIPSTPPRDFRDLPGLRLRNALSPKAFLSVGAVLALVALFPLLVYSASTPRRLALEPTDIVPAAVRSTSALSECEGKARRVEYEYRTPAGMRFIAVDTLCSASPFQSAEAGDSIPVRYLTSDAEVHRLAGGHGADRELYLGFFFLVPGFMLLAFLPFLAPQFLHLSRDRRLFRIGHVVPAVVVFVKGDPNRYWPGWPGTPSVRVIVQYRTLSGDVQESRIPCTHEWVVQQLKLGTKVHVAYDPQKSDRAALLDAYVK